MKTERRTIESLIRPAVLAMQPYQPILPLDVLSEQLGYAEDDLIKLDANENPYGPPPRVLEALRKLERDIPIYPDPESRHLRARLADHLSIDPAHILVGAGADELIDLIFRLFMNEGDAILNCPPTFGMYHFGAQLAGAQEIVIPRRPDFALDVDAIEQAVAEHDIKLIFITTPNNPDGGVISGEQLERLLALPVVLILDEAYIDFSDTPSTIPRVLERDNLITLRTFSKWAGLAGLRAGYGVFPPAIIAQLWKIKQPYNLSVAAQTAAIAALESITVLQDRVDRIRAERDRMAPLLAAISYLQPYPSQANFILCRVTGRDAAALKQRLAEDYGILIRYFNKPGLDDHIRISVGKPEHTDRLLAALKEFEGN